MLIAPRNYPRTRPSQHISQFHAYETVTVASPSHRPIQGWVGSLSPRRDQQGSIHRSLQRQKDLRRIRARARYRYLFEVNTRWTIDGSNRRNRARYINHSCRPNAEAYFVKHVIKIRAIKNIKPGDEITYHYGRDYFDSFIKALG